MTPKGERYLLVPQFVNGRTDLTEIKLLPEQIADSYKLVSDGKKGPLLVVALKEIINPPYRSGIFSNSGTQELLEPAQGYFTTDSQGQIHYVDLEAKDKDGQFSLIPPPAKYVEVALDNGKRVVRLFYDPKGNYIASYNGETLRFHYSDAYNLETKTIDWAIAHGYTTIVTPDGQSIDLATLSPEATPAKPAPLLTRLPWSYETETDLNAVPLEVANARADALQKQFDLISSLNGAPFPISVLVVSPQELNSYLRLQKKNDFRSKDGSSRVSPTFLFKVINIKPDIKSDPVRGGNYVEAIYEVEGHILGGRFYLNRPVFVPIPRGPGESFACTDSGVQITEPTQIRVGMMYGYFGVSPDKSVKVFFLDSDLIVFSN